MSFEFDWKKYKDTTGKPLNGVPDRLVAGTNAIMFDYDGTDLDGKAI